MEASRHKKYRWPLLAQLFLTIVTIVGVVAFVAGEVTRRFERDYLLTELRRHNEDAFAVMSAATLEAVISEDIPVLRTIVDEAASLQRDIYAVRIQNEDGESLVSWQRKGPDAPSDVVSYAEELLYEGDRYGRIFIDWSTERLERGVGVHVQRVRSGVTLILTLLAVTVLVVVHLLAVRPLSRIHRRLVAISQGKLAGALKVGGSREIVFLAESVDVLRETLVMKNQREAELERMRTELSEAKDRAEVTLHSIGDAVITTDAHGVIEYINPVAETLTAWSAEGARGRPLGEVFRTVNETSREPTRDPVARALAEDRIVTLESHTLLLARDGQEYAIEDSAAPIRGPDARAYGAVLVFHNVTTARNMARQIEYQASHDALTGLLNRAAFEHRLNLALHAAVSQGSDHALLYLDLDQFKVVNDTCGHAAGDSLLQQLAPILASQLRRGDTFGRLGGDEFGVILHECAFAQAAKVAEKLRSAITQFRFGWQGKTFTLGVSVGAVPINAEFEAPGALLQAADEACYGAKDGGRNRVHIYKSDDRRLEQRRGEMEWVTRLQSALQDERFRLFGQSIQYLGSDNSRPGLHYEVLLRMEDEAGNLVPPGAFVPAAERYGVMPSIDRWVIGAVLDWLPRDTRHLQDLCLCAINLSASSLSDEGLLDFIVQSLQGSGVPPDKLCFEITETAAMANLGQAIHLISSLKEIGCLFALDDFGAGMSSFGYLKSIPVDVLKIEGSFVRDIVKDDTSYALVKAINDIGHVMGKQTIAEFVENEAVLGMVRELGVDYAQGYGIGKPRPLEEFLEAGYTSTPRLRRA